MTLLPASSAGTNLWGGEFEHEILTAKASKESVYQEAAFFHKPSKTLLLCDAVISRAWTRRRSSRASQSTPDLPRAAWGSGMVVFSEFQMCFACPGVRIW